MSASQYDVIIIGTGAGGGTLAHRLASSGKRILLLERGDYVPREPDNWSTRAVNVEGKYQTKEQWRDKAGKALHPHTNYGVGGNTKFYGAALFRLRREDFGILRHHGGISPAWPISGSNRRRKEPSATSSRESPLPCRCRPSGRERTGSRSRGRFRSWTERSATWRLSCRTLRSWRRRRRLWSKRSADG